VSAPLLVLTSPGTAKAAEPWRNAAERAGWCVDLRPIAKTELVPLAPGAVDAAPPACVAVTSPNVLPTLVKLWESRPDLRLVPHAALGAPLGARLAEAGLEPMLVVRNDEATNEPATVGALAAAIADFTETGDRVLWLRGERSTDLREELVKAGRYVQAPVAYRVVPVERFRPPGRADAVFFASPEAAEAWLRRGDVPRATALALGSETYAVLAPEYARFVRMVRLPRPRPADLTAALQGLRPR
jgi:uroporphyrinogen-III synthase